MRPHIASLEGEQFDVVVVGGGINGASTAQHLAAAGYKTLIVDKGDFGSGASACDLTGLFWTKQCENMSLERSLGYAEEAV